MWYIRFSLLELQDISRQHLDTFEFWMRRLVDNRLSEIYGIKYQDAIDVNGQNVINNGIKRSMQSLLQSEPTRYPRWVDALTLDFLIDILCGNLYVSVFHPIFKHEFQHGAPQLRSSLEKLKGIRNRLSHLNPISARHAEIAICYSNDIIDIIKNYYKQNGMQQKYNVPSIVRYSSSTGLTKDRNHSEAAWYGWNVNEIQEFLPGESIIIEIEVDASFTPDEYEIEWNIWNGRDMSALRNHNKIAITFFKGDVNENFSLNVRLIQKKEWHRHGKFDDQLEIKLRVLQPPD